MVASSGPALAPTGMLRRAMRGVLNRWLMAVVAVTLVGLALLLTPKGAGEPEAKASSARRAKSQGCDLDRGPCREALGGGRSVEVTVSPRPVALLEPMSVEVRFAGGGRASEVRLTATSTTMDMGETILPLTATGDELFAGQTTLPVCASERLDWEARFDFQLDGVPRSTMRFSSHRKLVAKPSEAAAEPMDGPPNDFTLSSSAGPVSLSDFRGKVVLLYFGYTFCPDICPTSLAATARALKELSPEAAAQVQTIFVSVDPARDTPEHLKEYVAFFHPSIVGLTGTDEEVALAARPYGVVYARHEATGAGGYVVDHSAFTYLVAPDGHLAARLPHAAPARVVLAALSPWLHAVAPVPSK